MQPKTLRLKAAGEAMLPIFEKQSRGIRQFVGREYREIEPGVFGFAPTSEPTEVPFRAEYVLAVRAGDAEAADEETARACGVKFGGDKSTSADETPPAGVALLGDGRKDGE